MNPAPYSQLPPAVIVGIEGNGLGVARALSRFRIPCIAIDAQKRNHIRFTNSCRIIACEAWTSTHLIDLLLSIGSTSPGKMALLLTKDEAVIWVSEARELLEQFYFLNLPTEDAVSLLMSKVNFLRYANERNWPIPQTIFADSASEIAENFSRIKFPCILKPAVKNSAFRKYADAKAYIATTPQELMAHYSSFSMWEAEVVIQELVEGNDDRIVFCLAYYDKAEKELAIFPGRKLCQYPHGCGNTAIAAPAPKEWAAQILDISRTIFNDIGYRGLGSIEYKIDGNGHALIMEPTVGRTNWQNEIAVINGTNIPLIAYCDLTGIDPLNFENQSVDRPYKLVDGRAHFRLLRTHYSANLSSFLIWANQRSGRKKYMLWRLNDPLPFFCYHLFRAVIFFKKILVKIFRPKKMNTNA